MKNKILINGRSLAGKDVTGEYIRDEYGFKLISFAEPIYWICRNLLFMKRKNRKLLQFVGMFGRRIYSNIWVKIAY